MKILGGLVVVAVAIAAAVALLGAEASARTVTLTAPAAVERLSIGRAPDGSYHVMVHACATDASTDGEPMQDCGMAQFEVDASNTALNNLFAAALTAWKRAKGY